MGSLSIIVLGQLTTKLSGGASDIGIQLALGIQDQDLTSIGSGSGGNLLVCTNQFVGNTITGQSGGSTSNTGPSDLGSRVRQLHESHGLNSGNQIDLTTSDLNDITDVHVSLGQSVLSILRSNFLTLTTDISGKISTIDNALQQTDVNASQRSTSFQSRNLVLHNSGQALNSALQNIIGRSRGRDSLTLLKASTGSNFKTSTDIADISRVSQIYGIPISTVETLQCGFLDSSHNKIPPFI